MQQPTSGPVPNAVISSTRSDSLRALDTIGAEQATMSLYRHLPRRAAAQAGNALIEGVSA